MEQRGRLEVRLHLLVASALDGAEGSGAQSGPIYPGQDLPCTYGKYLGGLPALLWIRWRRERPLALLGIEPVFAIIRTYFFDTQIACSTDTTRKSPSSPWSCHCSLGPSAGNVPKGTFSPQAAAPCYSTSSGNRLAPHQSGIAKHFVAELTSAYIKI